MEHPLDPDSPVTKADRRAKKQRPHMVVEGRSVFQLQKLARAKQKSRVKKGRRS